MTLSYKKYLCNVIRNGGNNKAKQKTLSADTDRPKSLFLIRKKTKIIKFSLRKLTVTAFRTLVLQHGDNCKVARNQCSSLTLALESSADRAWSAFDRKNFGLDGDQDRNAGKAIQGTAYHV